MRRGLTLLCLALPLLAAAQGVAQPACTVHEHLPPARLGGEWNVSFHDEGAPPERVRDRGILRLERHPEYTDGVRGDLLRGSGGQMRRSLISGDVTEGSFHLDESDDGATMSAVWDGVAEDCGGRLRITGARRPAEGHDSPDPVLHFRMERMPGWR